MKGLILISCFVFDANILETKVISKLWDTVEIFQTSLDYY